MNNQLIPFSFEDVSLKEACWIDGKPYFTRRAIGEWLEYQTPDRAIHKIIERHPHINEFSVLVNLMNTWGTQTIPKEQRVYDPIGLQLIINKSDKPKAIQFQVAAAHLVVAFMQGKLLPSCWCKKGDRLPQVRQLLSAPAGYARSKIVDDIAAHEQKSRSTIYRWVEQSGERLLTKSGTPRRTRSDKGKTKYPEYKALVMAYKKAHPEKGYKQISTEFGLTYIEHCIKRWLRELS
jgi:transposase